MEIMGSVKGQEFLKGFSMIEIEEVHERVGKLFLKEGQYTQGLAYLEKALEICAEIASHEEEEEDVMRIKEMKGRVAEALGDGYDQIKQKGLSLKYLEVASECFKGAREARLQVLLRVLLTQKSVGVKKSKLRNTKK